MRTKLYNLLREDIQNKIGEKVLYGKDCELLAAKLNEKLKRKISSSTIKRFFGIVQSKFKPSLYTLDTFCMFLGYNDWNEYVETYKEGSSPVPGVKTWEKLKKQMLDITKQSLHSLKLKTNFDSKKMFLRNFAKETFEDFMESPMNTLIFTAPQGYGKSSMAIQLTEKYFLDENAKYRNDAIALIDGEIFFNLFSKKSNIPFLNQIIDFKLNTSVSFFFLNHPEYRVGRVCTIIDNVDEIYNNKVKFHNLIENISKIIMLNNFDWFKVVFTCHPENLHPFIHQINKNPVLKSSWYKPEFMDSNISNAINIPVFEDDEIETIINQFGFDYKQLIWNNKNIFKIIRYPYLLFLYLEEMQHGNTSLSELDLLKSYIQRKVQLMPYREEKISIINQFVELSLWGKESYSVKKKLLKLNDNRKLAYQNLITAGIIYEYTDPMNLLDDNIYVKFNQNSVFEYILYEKWRISKYKDVDLFFEIKNYYVKNFQLLCNLLNLHVRTLINNSKFDVIKQLHLRFENVIPPNKSRIKVPDCLFLISVAVNEALQTNKKFKAELETWISSSNLGKILYPVIE